MDVKTIGSIVDNFIASLEGDSQGKILKMLDLLEACGSGLRMPYSKYLESGLYELRITGNQAVRLFYTFHNNQAVILHGFVKKTNRIPSRELALARKRLGALQST
ncbi:MAG TPA: type II toxin-antitoxin system RelE/ParE family toxin [Candidatus Paceibacterota bacterium]